MFYRFGPDSAVDPDPGTGHTRIPGIPGPGCTRISRAPDTRARPGRWHTSDLAYARVPGISGTRVRLVRDPHEGPRAETSTSGSDIVEADLPFVKTFRPTSSEGCSRRLGLSHMIDDLRLDRLSGRRIGILKSRRVDFGARFS